MLDTMDTDPVVDALRKIFSAGDNNLMLNEGWITFEQYVNDCSKPGIKCKCGRDYDKILRSLLRDPYIKNIGQMGTLLAWFANLHFPKTSDPISNDIAYFLEYNAHRFNVEIEGLSWLVEIVEHIRDASEIYLPMDNNQNHIKLCTSIVDVLSYIYKPENIVRVEKYDQDLNRITDFLKYICDNIKDYNGNYSCFKRMCTIFLKESREEPISSALIVVIRVIDEQVWRGYMLVVVDIICREFSYEPHIVQMLETMCQWHVQPVMSMNNMAYLSKWLRQFMDGLERIKKNRIITEVAESVLPEIMLSSLKSPKFYEIDIQDNVVLFLMGKVNSLDLYHKVVMKMNIFITSCERTKVPAKQQKIVQSFIDKMTILLKRFEEHFESRSPCTLCCNTQSEIMQYLKEIELNSSSNNLEEAEEMEVSYPSTSAGHGRIDPSKVGLRNLGNTCYMNSVLQALVMTRKFCHEVLLYKTTNDLTNQAVLKNLQNLFALLKYSHRNSLAPNEILQACRPAYFMLGHQQDSSEFLCHLLDVMYEQEKSALTQYNSSDQNFSTKGKAEDKEAVEMEEAAGGTNSPLNEDGTSQNMTRWTTETNLSEGACLQRKTQSLADFTQGEELAQTQNGLSDSHSDSTDSGIQSVGGEDTTSSSSSTGASTSDYLVHRVFGGELKVSYLCLQCHTQSDNTDKFRDLQLCFLDDLISTDTITVQDLINSNYFKPESLTGDNKYRCDKCAGLCDAQRIIQILQAPAHLILTLKHFRYDSESRLRTKLRRKVLYNETIQLPISDQDPETYQLYAAVVHSGYSMDYGHYVTYACDATNRWYKFNDSYVSETTLEDFKRLEPPDTPYILFYKKCSDPSVEDAPESTSLSKTLQEYVMQDKRKSDEERKRARRATGSYGGSRFNSNNSWDRDKSDDDDGNPPPSNCRDALSIPHPKCCF